MKKATHVSPISAPVRNGVAVLRFIYGALGERCAINSSEGDLNVAARSLCLPSNRRENQFKPSGLKIAWSAFLTRAKLRGFATMLVQKAPCPYKVRHRRRASHSALDHRNDLRLMLQKHSLSLRSALQQLRCDPWVQTIDRQNLVGRRCSNCMRDELHPYVQPWCFATDQLALVSRVRRLPWYP